MSEDTIRNDKKFMNTTRKKYNYKWTAVNIRPDTKALLLQLCKAMGNEYQELPQSTVLDVLINERIQQLEK